MYEVHVAPFSEMKKSDQCRKVLADLAQEKGQQASTVLSDAIKAMIAHADKDGGSAI